jgi:hypothetical protein
MPIHLRKIMAGVVEQLLFGTCLQTWKTIAHGTVQAGMIITTNHDHEIPMSVSNFPKEIAIEAGLAGIHMIKNFQIIR